MCKVWVKAVDFHEWMIRAVLALEIWVSIYRSLTGVAMAETEPPLERWRVPALVGSLRLVRRLLSYVPQRAIGIANRAAPAP